MAVDPIRGAGVPQPQVAGTQTAALFEQHGRMVYGLCRTLLRDPDDADDATQSTFVSAYRSLLGGSEVREPAAWLATIARNECTARARARMREPLPLLDADLGHAQGPEAELDRKAVVEQLQQAISELPEKQREAVVLRDLYGLQYTEVSAALGMSVASVESLLFRARRSLRISLKPLATGALAVPVAVREGIAQALPGFTTAGAAGGGAASGAVGFGLLAKLTGVPVAAKIAAGVVAVTATGSVAVVGVEYAEKQQPSSVQAHAQPQAAGANALTARGPLAGLFVPVFVRDRAGAVSDDSGAEHAGRGNRGSGDGRGAATGATAGGSGNEGSEHGGSPNGGHQEDGGSTGIRSGGDDGAGTAMQPGHGDAGSGSTGSHDDGGSDDAKAPEAGDDLLSTEASGSGGDDFTSAGTDGSDTSDGSGSSGDSDPDGSSESPGDDPAVTTPPPA